MRKSSARTLNYLAAPSQNAERLRNFQQQMADYARGERLRKLRDAKHESQENAASSVGVSTKTLRAWEHGGKIRWENAKRLGSYYGEDPESLVSRETITSDGDTPTLSQLDRIEQRLEEIYGLLSGVPAGTSDEAARAVDESVARIEEKAGSPRKPAPGRRASLRAARPRSGA